MMKANLRPFLSSMMHRGKAIGPKGVKGGFYVGSPRGGFGRNRRIWLKTAQPMLQKAIQGLLSRFRLSPTTSIFDGFFADLNLALSAFFFRIGLENRKSPCPGVLPGLASHRRKGGLAPADANPAFAVMSREIMLGMSNRDRFEAIWIDSDTLKHMFLLGSDRIFSRIRRHFVSDSTGFLTRI